MPSFPDTPWSVILNTREPDSKIRLSALEELCRAYWPAVYSFARGKGKSPQDAEDLTQSFFVTLLNRDGLKTVNPENGRFRTWIIRCFENHLRDDFEKQNALKRGGDWIQLEITSEAGEPWWEHLVAVQANQGAGLDQIWALTLVRRATLKLESEWHRKGKLELFQQLRQFLDGEGDGEIYQQIGSQFSLSSSAVAMSVSRLRAEYAKGLRNEISETVENADDIADEFSAIRMALSNGVV